MREEDFIAIASKLWDFFEQFHMQKFEVIAVLETFKLSYFQGSIIDQLIKENEKEVE